MGEPDRSAHRKDRRGGRGLPGRSVQMTALTAKHFDIWTSERSYRYKEEALYSHAPQTPGIYQIAAFDEQQQGTVLHMGLTLDKSIYDALFEHWRGERQPNVQELLTRYPKVYFGFVVQANAENDED